MPALVGHVDTPAPGDLLHAPRVVVRGWHAWDEEPALAVVVSIDVGGARRTVVVPVGTEERVDVAAACGVPALAAAGWRTVLDLAPTVLQVAALGGDPVPATLEICVWAGEGATLAPVPPIDVMIRPPRPGDASGPVEAREETPPEPIVRIDELPADELPRAVVRVTGWALLGAASASYVELSMNGEPIGRARVGLDRLDLADLWSTPEALICGFEHLLDFTDLPPDTHQVEIVARAVDLATGLEAIGERRFDLAAPVEAGDDPELAVLASRRQRLLAGIGPPPATGPMNLAVFTHSLGLGGAQIWLWEVLRRTGAGREYPCTVVAPDDGLLRHWLEAQGVEVHLTPGGSWSDRYVYEGRVTELALFLAARGHDVVLANTVLSLAGADAGMAAGLPVVWAVHESWAPRDLWPSLFGPAQLSESVKRRMEEVLGQAAALVFTCRSTAALYEAVAAPGHNTVVPWGIDLGVVDEYCAKVSREQARADLGVLPEERMLLVVGTMEPRKAQALIAAAFGDTAIENPAARLALVGAIDSSYTRALRGYVEARRLEGRVLIAPIVEDTFTWYRAADALVMASDVEVLPRVLLESMAFGVPCAASAVFGAPELIVHGRNGWLFPPHDRAELTATIRGLLAHPAEVLSDVGRHGRATVEAGFDSAPYAGDLVSLLAGLRDDPKALPGDVLARAGRYPERRLPGPAGA